MKASITCVARSLAVSALLPALVSAAEVRTVALTGGAAPDTAFNFSTLTTPVVNDYGKVAFYAQLDDQEFNQMQGIWSEGSGALHKIILKGNPAPGTAQNFNDFDDTEQFLHINNSGHLAFSATVTSTFNRGVWTNRSGSLAKITIVGDAAPGANAPTTFNGIKLSDFNDLDQIFMNGFIPIPSDGVWSEATGSLLKIKQRGDSAPGAANYNNLGDGWGTINDVGKFAFTGAYGGGAGVWTDSSGTLAAVALTNQTAPGTPSTFSNLFAPTAIINDDGDVSFKATLNGLIEGGLRDGLWVRRNGSVELVAFESQLAPGTTADFSQITSDALIDNEGRATFMAQLDDGRDGLWSEFSGSLQKLVVQGETAPDMATTFLNILDTAVNERGQVAFKAQMSDFTSAIFALDAEGVLQKVIAEGDMLEVAPGDFRQVEFLGFQGVNGEVQGAGGGLNHGLNNNGQIAFNAAFNDSSVGVFVSDAVRVIRAGDLNEDGFVDIFDVGIVSDNWEENGNPGTDGDANFDGEVDIFDVGTISDNWFPNEGASAVPEPSTCVLMLVGAAVLACLRRRA